MGEKEREERKGEEEGEESRGEKRGEKGEEETAAEAQLRLPQSWVEEKLSEEGGAKEMAQQLEQELLFLQRTLVRFPDLCGGSQLSVTPVQGIQLHL